MYYIYIIECSDGSYYTGYTTDVEMRVKCHNEGKASRITRSKLPVKLIYKESFGDKGSALRREAEIKSWKRLKKQALVRGMAG